MSRPRRAAGGPSTPARRPGLGSRLAGAALGLAAWVGLQVLRALLGRPRRARKPPPVAREAQRVGHETRDMNAWVVAAAGVGLVVMLGVVLAGVTWLQAGVMGPPAGVAPPPVRATPAVPPLPPEPRLEAVPGQQLREVRAAEDALLNSYGWIDRQAGVAHMPIDRAIRLLAARGLPARSASEAPPADARSAGRPTDASSGRVPEGAGR